MEAAAAITRRHRGDDPSRLGIASMRPASRRSTTSTREYLPNCPRSPHSATLTSFERDPPPPDGLPEDSISQGTPSDGISMRHWPLPLLVSATTLATAFAADLDKPCREAAWSTSARRAPTPG